MVSEFEEPSNSLIHSTESTEKYNIPQANSPSFMQSFQIDDDLIEEFSQPMKIDSPTLHPDTSPRHDSPVSRHQLVNHVISSPVPSMTISSQRIDEYIIEEETDDFDSHSISASTLKNCSFTNCNITINIKKG